MIVVDQVIEVFSNGKRFANWTGARIRRSIDSIAGEFSLEIAWNESDLSSLGLFPGDAVEIFVDRQKVLAGFVEEISASMSGSNYSVSVSGSETTSILADCCLDGGEFLNKDLASIAREICAKFGVKFENKLAVNIGIPFEKFSVDPGSRAAEVLAKLCRERGILISSDGLGTVYLIDPDSCKRGEPLRQGENLESASMKMSDKDRFKHYVVLGTGQPKMKVKVDVTDSDVKRDKTLVVVDSNTMDKDKVQARADWERSVRAAKSASFSAVVPGWSTALGVWSPGVVCSFWSPKLGITSEIDLLLNSVTLSFSVGGGSESALELVSAESFRPQPVTSKKVTVKKTKSDPWKTIEKTVKS